MTDYRKEIDGLQLRLEDLFRRQEHFSSEMNALRSRISELRDLIRAEEIAEKTVVEEAAPVAVIEVVEEIIVEAPVIEQIPAPVPEERPLPQIQPQVQQEAARKPEPVITPENAGSGLERYIGQNLIPVIGIIITVIGVGIGAKYAIDHQLITPLTRILLGYLMGAGLLFFSLRLKNKYREFSAVLLSGSMAIFYFITFFAYSFYALIPLPVTFVLMVVITGATVYSAIKYDLPVIAHIGLVGAYAVPFLLSDGSGRIGIFFSYMAIINIGILIVSFFRNWKSLHYVAFGLTWFIYIVWFINQYQDGKHFMLSMIFLAAFFVIFYAMDLAQKLIKKEEFNEVDGMIILFNSFVFYGMGMTILYTHYSDLTLDWNYNSAHTTSMLGWFTLLNALIHFGVSALLYLRKATKHPLFYLSMILGISFLTIFIPIKLDGNWITLLWIFEGGLLFWLGRTQSVRLYEILSHPVIAIAFMSLFIQFFDDYGMTPFWNQNLLTAAVFAGVLFFVYRLSKVERYPAAYQNHEGMLYFTNNMVYVLLILITFFGVQHEISAYWQNRYYASQDFALNRDYFVERGDGAVRAMGTISNVLYALIFLSVVAFFKRKQKNTEEFNVMFMIAFILSIFLFLTAGLYELNFLHLKYLHRVEDSIYYRGPWLIGIRYVAYGIIGVAVFQLMKFIRQQMPWPSMIIVAEYILHTVIVWCCSAELVNWVYSVNSAQTYKLALSIFAGLYALFLIVLGIWKQKSYLRIGAISLFGITLLKLFFYDIRQLDTIFKTVIFISLGVLLLIIAFLYNKYKGRMFD